MRVILLFFFAALTVAGCGPTYSSLTLEPGARFVLGGPGDGAFRVELQNEGAAPITLAEQTPDGESVALGVLEPGEARSAQFGAGSAAVLTNGSDVEGRVNAEIRGGGDLSMSTTGGS